MAEQVLPVLEAHAGGPKSAAEGVLQVVNPDLRQARRARVPSSKPMFSMLATGWPSNVNTCVG